MSKLLEIIEKPINGEWGEDDNTGEGIPVLRTTNFTDNGVIDFSNVVTRKVQVKKSFNKFLCRGDIIIEKSGGTPNKPVGRVVFFEAEEGKYLFNNFTSVLRVKKSEAEPKYLFYYIFYKYKCGYSKKFQNKTTGIANLKIERFVKETEIPLPPLEVQKHIADTIDRTQEIIHGHKKQLKELDNLIKATFYDMFGDPVVNEKGWSVVDLGSVAKLIGGYAFKSTDYTNEGIRLVQIANVHKDIITWETCNYVPKVYLDKYSNYKLCPGDIVLAMTRPIIKSLDAVKIAVVKDSDEPCLLNQRVGKFEVKKELLNPYFLLEFCKTKYFKNEVELFSSNSLQPNVSSKQIQSIKSYLPPLDLQNKFADIVANIEEQKAIVKQSIKESETLFNSLMSKYFD